MLTPAISEFDWLADLPALFFTECFYSLENNMEEFVIFLFA